MSIFFKSVHGEGECNSIVIESEIYVDTTVYTVNRRNRKEVRDNCCNWIRFIK